MSEADLYRQVELSEIEILNNVCPVDLYVFMQASQKFVRFVAAGDALPADKFENLRRLSGTNLYLRKDAVLPAKATKAPGFGGLTPGEAFEDELLGAKAAATLKQAYIGLLAGGADATAVNRQITQMSDSLLSTLVPEAEDVRTAILKNLRNLHVMNHSAAITSLGVMVAVANDFTSRSALASLSHAILLMDASLAELEEHELDTYYRNRNELSAHVQEKVRMHPARSHQMVASLPIVTESVAQLILMHHELHNGGGYHRGIRTLNQSAMVRVLAFAVDLYELLKGSELREEPLGLRDAIKRLTETKIDAHMRRHSPKIVDKLIEYLGIK